MDCACDLDCDDDGPKVFAERIVTARKAHKCCECRGEIKPGEQYQQFDGFWDGGWSHYKTCRVCAVIREDKFPRCRPPFGDLDGYLHDCLGYGLDSADDDGEWPCDTCPAGTKGEPCNMQEGCKALRDFEADQE